MNLGENQARHKVSISARLIPALCYIIPALGGALGSFLLMNMMRALRESESAGVGAVLAGMAESMIPVLGSLYLSVILGIAVIAVLMVRMFTQTQTATPPVWFFIVSGLLFLAPAILFAEAQSIIIEVFLNPRDSAGLAAVASNISLFVMLSLVAAPLVVTILIALSVIPFSTSARPTWGPLFTAAVIQLLLTAVTIAFQMRYWWLNQSLERM